MTCLIKFTCLFLFSYKQATGFDSARISSGGRKCIKHMFIGSVSLSFICSYIVYDRCVNRNCNPGAAQCKTQVQLQFRCIEMQFSGDREGLYSGLMVSSAYKNAPWH